MSAIGVVLEHMTDELVLNDIRVLDFTWVLAGPYATRLLADYGAEVIKVQPFLPDEENNSFTLSYYNLWNRNKKGIILNLGTQEGIELAQKLVAVSDIVIENFSPRVMVNWGLDYENLKKIKPGIIMLSMSVTGQTGPHRDYTGFGPTVQALSGMTALTSFNEETPLGPGFSYADHVAGLYASMAVLGALEHRHQTGDGQYIDISQVEAMASLLGGAVMDIDSGKNVKHPGNYSCEAAPHSVYRCRDDDWIVIEVYSEEEWHNLKSVMGNPSWIDEVKFTSLPRRLDNREELDDYIRDWTAQFTKNELMELLQQNNIAVGAVQSAAELTQNPQLNARDFFIRDEMGKIVADSSPIKFSRTPATYRKNAPVSGQDNIYVYRDLLGLRDEEISVLEQRGTI